MLYKSSDPFDILNFWIWCHTFALLLLCSGQHHYYEFKGQSLNFGPGSQHAALFILLFKMADKWVPQDLERVNCVTCMSHQPNVELMGSFPPQTPRR